MTTLFDERVLSVTTSSSIPGNGSYIINPFGVWKQADPAIQIPPSFKDNVYIVPTTGEYRLYIKVRFQTPNQVNILSGRNGSVLMHANMEIPGGKLEDVQQVLPMTRQDGSLSINPSGDFILTTDPLVLPQNTKIYTKFEVLNITSAPGAEIKFNSTVWEIFKAF